MVGKWTVLQVWRVALYLEGCRWLNSIKHTLQNPIGLLGSIIALLVVIGLAWGYLYYQLYWRKPEPGEAAWIDVSSHERLQMSLLFLIIVSMVHLWLAIVLHGFRPYQFIREFSESDLHFLFATPLNSWRLIRALLLVRATVALGIAIPLYLVLAIMLAVNIVPVLVRDYIEQLWTGAWLLLGYWVLRYVQGLFFEFFSFYWALILRCRPWCRWLLLTAVCLWLLLLIGAMVGGGLIASARGASRVEALEYALNWLPTLLLSLPARATADAVLAIFTGWTPVMGIMVVLWAAGCLWLAQHLMRHSREIVDLVATGVQLGAGAQSGEPSGIPFAVRRLLERSSRRDDTGFRTPAWLERWQPTGIKALLWRDLVLDFRKTPAWLVILTLIATIPAIAGMLFGIKQSAQVAIDNRIVVFVMNLFALIFTTSMIWESSPWRKPNAYFDTTRSLPFSAEQHIQYLLVVAMLEIALWLLLPIGTAGLLIYPQVWYMWLGSLLLMASYTLSAILLGLVGELLTAQPYLGPVKGVFGVMRGLILLVLLIVGVGVYWLALGLGIWFPLFALLIGLISLPAQLYLMRQAVELWRNYTPLT
jgi:hypothetical protein